MSQNKNQLELPPIPERPMDIPYPEGRSQDLLFAQDRTLGKLAIMLESDALNLEDYVAAAQNVSEVAANLAASKRDPRYIQAGKIRTRIGQRRGKTMTDEESDFLESVTASTVRSHEYYDNQAQESRKRLSEEVQGIRTRLSKLNSGNVSILENYADSIVSSELLHKKKKSDESQTGTWAEWLAERAGDEDVLAFLREHNEHVLLQQNNPELASIIETQKEVYKTRVKQLVSEGVLHEDALHQLEYVDHIEVRIGDVFDVSMSGRNGYHISGQNFFVVNGTESDGTASKVSADIAGKNIRSIFHHEMNHAVLGEFGARWIDEAFTELIAADIAQAEPTAYANEIELLATVLGEDRSGEAHKLGKRAYSEIAGTEAHAIFLQRVKETWGKCAPTGASGYDIISTVNAYVAQEEKAFLDLKMELGKARRYALFLTQINLASRPESVLHFEQKNESPSGEGLSK